MSKLKRIYHIADIHIRNIKRHKEFREVFYAMFDEIKKRGTEDSIIYLAGDIAHAKLEMSPELVKEISWLLTECSNTCTTIMIAGNHDCNMNNADRLDVLTPIVDALKLPNLHYLRDTSVFSYQQCEFGVFSIFDNQANWPKAEDLNAEIKIALFHGPVDNSTTDVGYVVSSRHFTTDIFDGYHLALLGDIHKRQEMISPKGCKVVYARMMADITAKYGVEDFTIIRTDSFQKKKTGDREARLEVDTVADINHQNSLIGEYIERMMPFVTKEDLEGIEKINRDINSRITADDTQRNISWKPVKFEFSNMFSYGENNVINFDKVNGLMGLFAPNAQGKSSLFDAISFCLFDKCSRAYKAAAIMNNRKSDFHCQLDFTIDGVQYHIRREGRTINKGKNVKVDVDFWKDGDSGKESLNGTERRDTNQVIEGYVGRYEDFVMTALSLQANNALFIDKSQSERKDLMAQFMGLDIFDKLYETATNDIKDVNALIRNFKRTDFTTELAQKETDLNEKKVEYGELDSKEMVREAKEMVDSKATINEIGIEVAYSNYQKEQKNLIEAEKVYSTVKSQLNSAEEKINHLNKHEYDPNCKFCCDNEFVKDAMRAKEALPELQRFVQNATIQCTGIQQTLDSWEGVEEQFNQWKEWTDEHKRLITIRERLEGDIRTADSKIELLQTQTESVNADIQRYNDNEETITKNQALDVQIQNVRREKQGVEKQISDVNKLMLKLMSDVGATKTYIDNMKAKMEEVKELETKNQLYTFYLDAVKKDGVPYELISKALPAIEGLAIRVALINICNLPRPNFLVIDEGFGTLDADNLSSLFMMMQYLKTQFDFIWVISHLEQMRDIVDGLIEIKKIDGFSKIKF